MIKLVLYTFFNIAGIGCLVSIPFFSTGLSDTAFVGLAGGAAIACLAMVSILAFVEIGSRCRNRAVCIHQVDKDDYEAWYWQRFY